MKLENKKIGIVFTASYCTLEKVFLEFNKFKDKNCEIIPIVSNNIYFVPFGQDASFNKENSLVARMDLILKIS